MRFYAGKNFLQALFIPFFLSGFLSNAAGLNLDFVPKLSTTPKTPEAPTDRTVETKEAMVDIEGTHYREIQYQGKSYYLKSLEREPSPTEPLECMTLQNEKKKTLSPQYLYGELNSSRRSQSFIFRLQNDCETQADIPHPAVPSKSLKAPTSSNDPGGEGRLVSHPADQEVGISFDSKQHRSKGTDSGAADGGVD